MIRETELERITRLIEQQRQRTVADLDHEAADSLAELAVSGCAFEPGAAELLGRCYQASRAREKRLEALVRSLGKCTVCGGEGYVWQGHDVDSIECDHCAGTGLVEAAQKELSHD